MAFKKIFNLKKKMLRSNKISFMNQDKVEKTSLEKWTNLTIGVKRSIISHYLGSISKNRRKELINSLKSKFELMSEDVEAETILTSEDEVLFDYIWSQIPYEEKQKLFESGIADKVLIEIHGTEEEFYKTQIIKPGKYKNKL
ncbi:MAG: hypothetical protein ACFFDB_00030 [Promethearchaeota archaeon]